MLGKNQIKWDHIYKSYTKDKYNIKSRLINNINKTLLNYYKPNHFIC